MFNVLFYNINVSKRSEGKSLALSTIYTNVD